MQEWAQQDASSLKKALKDYWDRIETAADGLTEGQADFKTGPEEFSLREMVHHFAYTIEREGQRIDGLLKRQPNDDLPMGPGMMPPGDIPPYPNVMRDFRETTSSFFKMLDGIDDAYNIDVQSRNNVIGPLNWKEWMAWMLRHANDHVEQAENIRSDPAFPS
jgi:hypothetical protein